MKQPPEDRSAELATFNDWPASAAHIVQHVPKITFRFVMEKGRTLVINLTRHEGQRQPRRVEHFD
jgi:hypothetical protein